MSPPYEQNMSSNGGYQLVRFPREASVYTSIQNMLKDEQIYVWAKFQVKSPLFDLLRNIEKMVKNSIKRP